MPHVLVAGAIHEAGLALLRAAPGVTLDVVEAVSTESYAPLVGRADAVLIRTQPMPAAVIDEAPRLAFVSRHGVGFDAVDVAALNRRSIPLAIVGDVNSQPVAEHAMMLILALAKRALVLDAATRQAGWARRNGFEAFELAGKALLLVGFGRIGRRVAGMAEAFGMRVLVHDPFVGAAAIRAAGAEPAAALDAALGEADIVSLHVPLGGDGVLIGAPELKRMKPTAILVNTARGGLVDEAALAAALAEGGLAGAGLDVFAGEPPPADHPLLGSDRVVLSPHSASLTRECAARMSVAAAQNILDFFAGRLDPALVVNAASLPPAGRRQMQA
ncbi:NAD(P)-dependent oxidoreductase [Labrys wisconsinensis]|uniref:D-3-phosphoglycerate dehydrogenase n=1 Tax=Labrys wisconsinensis TaxID=425677 RepID=A0ABU0JQK6_9HYPH|nr:NAD(P)-dependent oxidoreductase [Labrys wisconsinensis]MDQ0475427.1 D-3-phosphoglycerate dehydrogenase [Labrys wisconsinensis]